MRSVSPCHLAALAFCIASPTLTWAQGFQATGGTEAPKTTIAVDARLVMVPAVVYDKKGLVTTLTQSDFALTMDGAPQNIRYFDKDDNLPLTVGLLVDTSRSQTEVLDAEQKASQKFLDSFLHGSGPGRAADRAFVLQFAHSAELLQDVTQDRPLLEAALKEIGTQAPGADEGSTTADNSNNGSSGNNTPSSSSGGYPGSGGRGGYGRRSGYPSGGSSSHGDRATGGTVLYDSIFLASDELLAKQKGRRALIVLTDGVDRHSKESLSEAIEAAQRADTVVYAIYYKGHEAPHDWNANRNYGGYDPYGRYPPTTGGSTDPGTYRDPDGKKILERICSETGGRSFELKGKGSVDDIYAQIGAELRAQYRIGFTPSLEAGAAGYHAIQLSLTNPAEKHFAVQTRNGVYLGAAKPH